MDDTPLPLRTFLSIFGKWLHAIENNRDADATYFADELRVIGRMLAMDPDFHRIFNDNKECASHDGPRYALECLHAFLNALTEASRLNRSMPRDS
jgi:hypothetical protein